MTDPKDVEQALTVHIRPLTFRLAIKILKSDGEMPENTRRLFEQMKIWEEEGEL